MKKKIKAIGWVNLYSNRTSSVFESYKRARDARDTYPGNLYLGTTRVFIKPPQDHLKAP